MKNIFDVHTSQAVSTEFVEPVPPLARKCKDDFPDFFTFTR